MVNDARHVVGCRFTQHPRLQKVVDDVAGRGLYGFLAPTWSIVAPSCMICCGSKSQGKMLATSWDED